MENREESEDKEKKKSGSPNPQSGLQSLDNIPANDVGATAKLTLKIHVDTLSYLFCTTCITTGMSFEMFILVASREQQNTYFMFHQGLVTISTYFGLGKHTIVSKIPN